MRPSILKKMVDLVSDGDYVFMLSNIILVQKLFSSKKQEALLLTQQEYECLKKILEGAAKSTLKAEVKKKYADWFSQQCFVNGSITIAYYQQCTKKSILKDVFFELSDNHYAAAYQLMFTANKISFLVNNCRKEIDADVFLHRYNESAKNRGLVPKAAIMDLLQFQNPVEIACFKETIINSVEKAELVQAKWQLPSNKKNVSSTLVFNKNEQKFFIQKENTNIELKPNNFLNDFKKQYRKERPWYGNVAEWLGFGTLGKLKKQSTDVAKIEFLLNHVKNSSDSTTAKTLESLFQSTDFLEDFKKQYRKERPWYGFLTEKMGAGTLGKLKEPKKNPGDFLRDHGKEKSDSTTAKTLESLKEFAVYGAGVVDGLVSEKVNDAALVMAHAETLSASSDRQSPISSDRLSVEAMIKMRDFSLQRFRLEKKEQEAREVLIPGSLVEFKKGFESIGKQEKVERAQTQKLMVRRNFLKELEKNLKLFWVSVDKDERNLNGNQKKYIEVTDVGVTKIQCTLNFMDHKIAALAAFVPDDESIKTHQWIQSVRVLYEKFDRVRECLGNLALNDEGVNNKINELMLVVNRLVKAELLDKNVCRNLSRECALYQVNVENMKLVSAEPVMRL